MSNRRKVKPDPTPPAELPELLTIDEVAAYLHVSAHTVERLIAKGELPALRVTGRGEGKRTARLINRADLDRFIREHTV